MKLIKLYIGTNPNVSIKDNQLIVSDCLDTQQLDYTMYEGIGCFHGKVEDSIVVDLITPRDISAQVLRAIEDIKILLKQTCILYSEQELTARLV